VVAEVIDEGVGIRRADLNKIFEPFYTTKPPGRGTGLGLSVCYSIVSAHGGRIEVDSIEGSGSVFRILLPRHS
jgi:signal transduction histidine kinase